MRFQPPKIKMIDSLCKPVSETFDEGKVLLDFYFSSGERKHEQIVIFRACKFLDKKWRHKFTAILVQKHPPTKFFQKESPDNVPPATTCVDNQIYHPLYHDFYMYSEAGTYAMFSSFGVTHQSWSFKQWVWRR